MTLWVVLVNGQPDKCSDDISDDMLNRYRETGDLAFMIVAQSIINIFDDKSMAEICRASLERDYPEHKFTIGELHLVTSSVEWS